MAPPPPNNPNANILTLTATPKRTDGIDVVLERFGGNVSYEMDLVEALAREIVQSPDYVTAIYTLQGEVEDLEKAIQKESGKNKEELDKKLFEIKRRIAEAPAIPDILNDKIKPDGRYMVFCPLGKPMDETIATVTSWFEQIGVQPEVFTATSKQTKHANRNNLADFQHSKSSGVKLLFSQNILNEGVHAQGVDGAIMLRPTESMIVYLQQLGRVLSSEQGKERAVVFDFVNNWRLFDIEKEIQELRKGLGLGGARPAREFEGFDFEIDTNIRDFYELLQETQGEVGIQPAEKTLEKCFEWSGKNGRRPKEASKEPVEAQLGSKLRHIEKKAKKEPESPLAKRLTEYNEHWPAQEQGLPYEESLELCFKWSAKHGRRPRIKTKNDKESKEETRLGRILGNIREKVRKNPESPLAKRYAEYSEEYPTHPRPPEENLELCFAWSNNHNARPKIASKDGKEKSLASFLSRIQWEIKKDLESPLAKRMAEYNAKWPAKEKCSPKETLEVCFEWSAKHGRRPSSKSQNSEEARLGQALTNTIRNASGRDPEIAKRLAEYNSLYPKQHERNSDSR